jgi:hypothetical protein
MYLTMLQSAMERLKSSTQTKVRNTQAQYGQEQLKNTM